MHTTGSTQCIPVQGALTHGAPMRGGLKGTHGAPKSTRGAPKGTRGGLKGMRDWLNGTRSAPKGMRSAPKGTHGAPKGTRGGSKGMRGAPKGTRGAPAHAVLTHRAPTHTLTIQTNTALTRSAPRCVCCSRAWCAEGQPL